MTQENAEIVRAMLDTWNTRGIFETIDAFDPDVELVDLQAVMGMQDRGRGPEELHEMAEQWTEIFEDWGLEVHDVVDLGGDFVLAEVRFEGIGRDSGAPVSNRQFEVYRLVGGKIVEIRVGFHDRDQAVGWMGQRKAEISQEDGPPR
ncbi:MAG: nuclear transport factor 2 family protein [Thermoleophilaceae bacterium]|jgi:ketosteroid isomerase-like protein